jgi:hypothetical protein
MCKIGFTLDEPSYVTIKIVNVLGLPQFTALNAHKPKGYNEIEVDISSFTPGNYYYKIHIERPSIGKNGHSEISGMLMETNTITHSI